MLLAISPHLNTSPQLQRPPQILCRGKVLFPSSAADEEVATQLIHHSSSSSELRKTPDLLVMGTPHSQHLKDSRISMFQWLYGCITSLLWWSYPFIEPFLPQMLRLPTRKED